ncbi:OsmC family protein [Olivibacter sp. SDN3]|uniref:OsmC family protein n=1 Tax=Olivibacter sp. SDN3 TaxID=2764720 RepID=UPI0016515BE6|nr:OsmC family protein [Olivibacter sp. SDN3]QNL50056.1 OsmC family protein [Olivibacter sp. SDN3]
MATVDTVYLGDLRTEAKHVQSQTKIITDAPVDNQGKGEAFSPTDLLVASLTSCMLTIMGIVSRTHNISLGGIKAETTKIMQAEPRKVSEIHIIFHFADDIVYNSKEKALLKKAAETCPVYLSLASDIKKTITFNWVS